MLPNNKKLIKKNIIKAIIISLVFVAGIFVGNLKSSEKQESLVFAASRDSCVFADGEVICIP
jgi:hypothetical protein